MDYEVLTTFILASATLAIFPGPDNIYVLAQGLSHGKKYGLATTAGLISGCLVHTTLLAFGVSALIKENDGLFLAVKLFGALYLLYLAYKVFQGGNTIDLPGGDGTGVPRKSTGQLFRQGFIMNVLNPKVTLFFLAFFPGFLFSPTMDTRVQFYVLGLLFMVVSFAIFALIAILSGSISDFIKRSPHAGTYLKWLQILVFLGIVFYLLLSE